MAIRPASSSESLVRLVGNQPADARRHHAGEMRHLLAGGAERLDGHHGANAAIDRGQMNRSRGPIRDAVDAQVAGQQALPLQGVDHLARGPWLPERRRSCTCRSSGHARGDRPAPRGSPHRPVVRAAGSMVALRARMPWSTRIVPRGAGNFTRGSTTETDSEASGGPTLTQNCWSTPKQTLQRRQRIRLAGPGIEPVRKAGDHFRQRIGPTSLQRQHRPIAGQRRLRTIVRCDSFAWAVSFHRYWRGNGQLITPIDRRGNVNPGRMRRMEIVGY